MFHIMTSEDPARYVQHAEELLAKGKTMEALEVYSKASQLAPENAEIWFKIGAIKGWAGLVDEAMPYIDKAIELDPEYPQAMLVKAGLLHKSGNIQGAMHAAKLALEAEDARLMP